MLGYSDVRKAYRLWDESTQSIIHSIDVIVDEEPMFCKGEFPILQFTSPPQKEAKNEKEERRKVGPGSKPPKAKEEMKTEGGPATVAAPVTASAEATQAAKIHNGETKVKMSAAESAVTHTPARASKSVTQTPATVTIKSVSRTPQRERGEVAASAPRKTAHIEENTGARSQRARRALTMPEEKSIPEKKSPVRKSTAPKRLSTRVNKGGRISTNKIP